MPPSAKVWGIWINNLLGTYLKAWAFPFLCLPALFTPASFASGIDGVIPVAAADSPAFSRAWRTILTEAGLQTSIVAIPQGRRRRMFVDGLIIMDCCVSPAYRDKPEEKAVQLFSDSFYEVHEHYIFRSGETVEITAHEQLAAYRFAGVRGFQYPQSEYFGTRIDGRNIDDALRLIEIGRANIGIISGVTFRTLMAQKPRNLELGGIVFSSTLQVRLHKSRADLLPRINAAIARLKADGRLLSTIN